MRDLITSASSGDTINFDLNDTISLTTTIGIDKSITIDGSTSTSPIIISGTDTDRIFYETATTNVEIVLKGLTLTQAFTSNNLGGAVLYGNSADFIFENCMFINNRVLNNNGRGGAVTILGGTLVINDCEFENNRINYTASPNPGTSNQQFGGALILNAVSLVEITNSTFYNNSLNVYAKGRGGAIYFSSCPVVTVKNNTFYGNVINSGLPRTSGGSAIYVHGQSQPGNFKLIGNTIAGNSLPDKNNLNYIEGGTVHFTGLLPTYVSEITSNIIYDNVIASIADDSLTDISSTEPLNVDGYNFIEYAPRSLITLQADDHIAVDPQLGNFQNNGGVTRTVELPCTSPSYRAGNPVLGGENAQNSKLRKAFPDAGAYEHRLDLSDYVVAEPKCFGAATGSITLSMPTITYNYAWSEGLPSGKKGTSVAGVTGGIVSLYMTETGTNCADTFDLFVNEPDEILISGVVTNDMGGGTGAIDITVSGGTQVSGYDFTWAPNGEQTEDLSGLSADNYVVTVVDDNDCEVEETFTVALVTGIFEVPEESDHVLFPTETYGDLQVTNLDGVHQCILTSMSGIQYKGTIINGSLSVKHVPMGRYIMNVVTEQVALPFQKL